MRIIHLQVGGSINSHMDASVSAIGFFDGLHAGHRQLIAKAMEIAKEKGLKSSLITFSPSPQSFLLKSEEHLLTTISERIKLAEEIGLDQIIILKFNKKLSQLSPDEFHEEIIQKMNIKHLVCGEDFRYGFKGAGSVESLKTDKRFSLSVINDIKAEDNRISSTLIKSALSEGDLVSVEKYLTKPYAIDGYVKHGRKLGRTIGFPTVNLSYSKTKILPRDGIYIGITTVRGKNYVSTINIGHNPTVNTVIDKSVESFIHDFDEDIYNERVSFKFIKRIRDELKFSSVEELISQMHKDIQASEDFFDSKTREGYEIETI